MTPLSWMLLALLATLLPWTTLATRRYLHWRSRARQLHGALEGCSNDLSAATDELRRTRQERDFYRDAARKGGGVRSALNLVQGAVPETARRTLDIVRRD